ncbi:MAG: short-chain dehydrogenase [Burkholderiales bacterium PBB5]|nr:MAG: short-chain dehydrogenase [Burkholderiales bacterium PBB5]
MSLNPRIRDWRGQRVWLVGASTGIGRATAVQLHALGARVIVSARGVAALADLAAQCPGLQTWPLDVTDAGALQSATYVGALNLLAAVLPVLLRQAAAGQAGHLSLVASVAGYRGLPQALAYGPTKAALINLAEVLYLDLATRGVGVSLINPGFVETPLTAQNAFHMPALISPEHAADAMLQGWAQGRFEIHFPKRFTRLLKLMRWLPDSLYFQVVRRAVSA